MKSAGVIVIWVSIAFCAVSTAAVHQLGLDTSRYNLIGVFTGVGLIVGVIMTIKNFRK